MDKNLKESNGSLDLNQIPKALEFTTFLVSVLICIIGAIIGMQLITTVGVTANTSIIGVMFAVMVGFIPIKIFKKFRDIHVQNLVQTSISSATFAAGNVMMLALGIAWLSGDTSLLIPMFIGATIGVFVDVIMMYWMFDTPTFPAKGTWPVGVASSEALLSVKEGGKRVLMLLGASGIGAIGQHFRLPMDIAGVCLIGNKVALTMFGTGLIIRAYSPQVLGIDINAMFIPHGLMIGAGVVSIAQLIHALVKAGKKRQQAAEDRKAESMAATEQDTSESPTTRTAVDARKALLRGAILFTIGAVLVALISGIYAQMGIAMLVIWVLYASITSIIGELIVGTAAMHSGWFPAFAVTLIFLVIGMFIGFPITALVVLLGYQVCIGPAFADMGYDLKAGWIVRGKNKNSTFELAGRREQFKSNMIGITVGIVVVFFGYQAYFLQDLFPPVARVFVATIEAGANPEIMRNLVMWAFVGAAVQAIGGTKRQMGVMLATGLLIFNQFGGFVAISVIIIRTILEKKYGEKINNTIYATAAGFIVGSSMYGFITNSIAAFGRRN